MRRAVAALLLLPPLIGAAPAGRLDFAIEGLRSGEGKLRVCLTVRPDRFPDCRDDPEARTLTAPAASADALRFDDLPSGDYALAVIHDANGNGRLDTLAGIPREGFGFSRNPALRFGPPRFSEARFAVGAGKVRQDIRMRYIL